MTESLEIEAWPSGDQLIVVGALTQDEMVNIEIHPPGEIGYDTNGDWFDLYLSRVQANQLRDKLTELLDGES